LHISIFYEGGIAQQQIDTFTQTVTGN